MSLSYLSLLSSRAFSLGLHRVHTGLASRVHALFQSTVVPVVATHPRHRMGQPLLIASLGKEIDELVGTVEGIEPARIAGVGVKDAAGGILGKDADARRLR